MKTSLVLLLGAGSVPVNQIQQVKQVNRRSDDTYGSWDWFINQIANDNKDAKPTESAPEVQIKPSRSSRRRIRLT